MIRDLKLYLNISFYKDRAQIYIQKCIHTGIKEYFVIFSSFERHYCLQYIYPIYIYIALDEIINSENFKFV